MLPIPIICLDFLGPSTAGQTLTSTFRRPCDSVFTGKTRSHSFLPGGMATESQLKYNLETLHNASEMGVICLWKNMGTVMGELRVNGRRRKHLTGNIRIGGDKRAF